MSVLNVTLSVCEAAESDVAEYTAIIEPLDRSVSWTVTYRFTYFRVLKDLIDNNSSVEIINPFPSISKVSWILKMDNERLTKRKKKLQRWLVEVIAFYNEFPEAVKIALSSFLNGTNSAERIENFIDSRLVNPPVESFSILDRCFVSVTEIESADPPLYVFCISSLWGRTWTVTYPFTSFCKLFDFITDRYPRLMVTTFPDTTIRSQYRVKLRFYDLADRHFKLKAWMSELLRRFDELPIDVQEQVCRFYEAHPDYQPVEVYMEAPKSNAKSKTSTPSKGMVMSGYSNLKGSLVQCVAPSAGASKLLGDLGLADDVLWSNNGRMCSEGLSDIAACLDDPRLGLRTKCPSLDVKHMIASQFVKWAEIKITQFNDMGPPNDPPTAAQEDWNWEVEIIQSALPALYDVIYTITTCRDDDDVKAPTRRGSLKSNSFSSGGEYHGYQIIAAKLAASLRSLSFLEHRILPLSFQCLERILDSNAVLGSQVVLGTMNATTAQSMRTETCVSLLGVISDFTRHINSIRNASSVVEKLLADNPARPIPAALKATAALIQGAIANGQVKQKRTKSVVLNVPAEASSVIIASDDADSVGVLGGEAAQALRQLVLSPALEISDVARLEKRKSRRLSNEDMKLLRMANGEFGSSNNLAGDSALAEEENAKNASAAAPDAEQEATPIDNSANIEVVHEERESSATVDELATLTPKLSVREARTSSLGEIFPMVSASESDSESVEDLDEGNRDADGDEKENNANVSLKELYREQLRSAFDGLRYSVKNGSVASSGVTLESLLGWEMIQEVIGSGELTEDKIAEVFSGLAAQNSGPTDSPATIDFDAFCSLMEVLEST